MPELTAGKIYVGSSLVAGGLVEPFPLLQPVTVTPVTGGTAHAAGSWVEVTASTSAASQWLIVTLLEVNGSPGADTSTIIEVGTGGSGSETVVGQFAAGYRSAASYNGIRIADLPFPIASGTRIAVRARSTRTSQNVAVSVATGTLPFSVAAPIPYGVDLAASKGVTIANPASTGTPGAWTELVSSTSVQLMGLHLGPQAANATSIATGSVTLELGLGGSGSESTFATVAIFSDTSERLDLSRVPNRIPWLIPAGSRISARYTRSGTHPLDLLLHGIPA